MVQNSSWYLVHLPWKLPCDLSNIPDGCFAPLLLAMLQGLKLIGLAVQLARQEFSAIARWLPKRQGLSNSWEDPWVELNMIETFFCFESCLTFFLVGSDFLVLSRPSFPVDGCWCTRLCVFFTILSPAYPYPVVLTWMVCVKWIVKTRYPMFWMVKVHSLWWLVRQWIS